MLVLGCICFPVVVCIAPETDPACGGMTDLYTICG